MTARRGRPAWWRPIRASARSPTSAGTANGPSSPASRSRGDNNLYLVDLATGREELLTPHEPPGSSAAASWRPTAAASTSTSNKDADRTYLRQRAHRPRRQAPGPSRSSPSATTPRWTSSRSIPSGVDAAVNLNVAGRVELAILESRSGASLTPSQVPARRDRRRARLLGRRQAAGVMAVGGATAPTDIWVLGRLQSGVQARSPTAPTRGWTSRSWRARAGALPGARRAGALRLALPAAGRAGPARWCSASTAAPRGRSGPASTPPTRRCSSRGIAVFAPNVRGSSGFGKKFVNLDNGPLRVEGGQGHQGLRRLPRRRRGSPTRSGSASWAAPTAAT